MALFALKEKYKQQLSTDELGRLHELYMEFILYFKKICIENDLQFYLCGGGCIGAVRNRGFIPWDDDLDVFMPREDYEKLKSIWEYKADNNRYPILYPTRDRILHNQFITIIDANTTFIRPYQKDLDIPHGIALDVFPLDGCPSNKWQRKKQIFWGLVYSLFCSQVIPNNHGALLYYIGKSILGIIPQSFFYTIWKHAEDKMSSYKWDACDKVTELCAGPHYMMNEYPKRAFLKSLWWLAGKESQRRALPLSSKGKIITDYAQTQMTDLLMSDLLVTDPLVTGLQETNLPGEGTKWLSRMKRVQTRIFHVGIGRTHSCLLYFLTWRICNLRRQQVPERTLSEKTVPKKGRTSTFPLRKLLQGRSCPGRQSPDMQKKDALNSAGLGERSESPATDLSDGLRHGKRS